MKKILKNKTVIAILIILSLIGLSFIGMKLIEKYNESKFDYVTGNMIYLLEINLSLIDQDYELEGIESYFDRIDSPIFPNTKRLYKKALMCNEDNYTEVFYEINDEFYRLNDIADVLFKKEKKDVE